MIDFLLPILQFCKHQIKAGSCQNSKPEFIIFQQEAHILKNLKKTNSKMWCSNRYFFNSNNFFENELNLIYCCTLNTSN